MSERPTVPLPGPGPRDGDTVEPAQADPDGQIDEAALLAPLTGLHELDQQEWPARYARVLDDLSAALQEDS